MASSLALHMTRLPRTITRPAVCQCPAGVGGGKGNGGWGQDLRGVRGRPQDRGCLVMPVGGT
jgi:hypothetical protein